LKVTATEVGNHTVLAQIIRLVERAQGSKLPIQGLADRVVREFTPAVMLTALVTFIAWLVLGPPPAITLALVSAVAVLVGADRLMQREGIDIAPLAERVGALTREGKTPVYLAVDGRVRALLAVADPVKVESPSVMSALRERGIRVVRTGVLALVHSAQRGEAAGKRTRGLRSAA
jgi:cation transport ATPase